MLDAYVSTTPELSEPLSWTEICAGTIISRRDDHSRGRYDGAGSSTDLEPLGANSWADQAGSTAR